MLFTGAEQDWAGTCCLLKQHCHHPPLLSHHWLSGGWRLLAPLAESLVGHVGTRHSTAEWRHSDVENSGTPSMIIGLLVLQTVIFAWTPSEKREFQSISAGARDPVKLPMAGAAHLPSGTAATRPTGCKPGSSYREEFPPSQYLLPL